MQRLWARVSALLGLVIIIIDNFDGAILGPGSTSMRFSMLRTRLASPSSRALVWSFWSEVYSLPCCLGIPRTARLPGSWGWPVADPVLLVWVATTPSNSR